MAAAASVGATGCDTDASLRALVNSVLAAKRPMTLTAITLTGAAHSLQLSSSYSSALALWGTVRAVRRVNMGTPPAALCPLIYRTGTARTDMLVCGKVNPPPEAAPDYRGVFFGAKDDMHAHARSMKVRFGSRIGSRTLAHLTSHFGPSET